VRSLEELLNIEEVHESIRQHESTGRAFLYAISGVLDVEREALADRVVGLTGKSYINWGGYGVFLLGHSHKAILGAVIEQAQKLAMSSRSFPHSPLALFHREAQICLPSHLKKVMMLSTGSEAVEAALKLSRAKTGRHQVLHLEKSYHGKTLGALSVTDCESFRGTLDGLNLGATCISRSDSDAATAMIRSTKPAAVIFEPIQGEGGIFELAPHYLQEIAKAATESGALLICDEIQCGLGRTGEMWAHTQARIQPDILLAGKALGGGIMPVSAMFATQDAYRPFDRDPLLHSSTFAGNPLAAAAAGATLRQIKDACIVDAAFKIGERLSVSLTALTQRHTDLISHVSGRGLMRGLHFHRPEFAATFLQAAMRVGLLLTPCLTTPATVRLSPPVVDTSIDLGLELLEQGLNNSRAEN
jgi:putrescine aminotransferase